MDSVCVLVFWAMSPSPSSSLPPILFHTHGWDFPYYFIHFQKQPPRTEQAFPLSRPGERRRQRHPTPVLLPGKSHGRRSLVGCSPWGWEESDMTERLHFQFSLLCTGEGNGNPLQCSCLENPKDGVAQSRTRLK